MQGHGQIEVLSDGETPVLLLIGEFDLGNRELLHEEFAKLQDGRCRHVVLDMSETSFIDSTTLGALVRAHHDGLRFTLRGATGAPRRALEVVGLDGLFGLE
jgi:anti-anti-sigma factor